MSRTIAVTTLLDGRIEIGQHITVSTIMPDVPFRTTYRGLVFDIRTWGDGCDYAQMVVPGMQTPISIRLEPLPTPQPAPPETTP